MVLENKLGISDQVELAREEEQLSKIRAIELFEKGILDTFEVESLEGYRLYTDIFFKMFMILQGKFVL